MSLPREQEKSQPAWPDLAVFAGVLAFMAYSVQAFLAPRAAPRRQVPRAALVELQSPVPSRAPASLGAPRAGSTEVLRLPCLRTSDVKVSRGTHLLRIQASLCDERAGEAVGGKAGGEGRSSDAWKAVNQSSGEEILVFVSSRDRSLSTSYFTPSAGRSEVLFVQSLGGGRIRREKLTLVRQGE